MFAALVEAEALAVNFEETFSGFPVLTLATHAFAEDGGIELSTARFADPVHHAIGFGRQFLAQALFKIRRDTARQTKHVDESQLGSGVFRAF